MTELKLLNRAGGISGLLVLGLLAGSTAGAAPKPPKPSVSKIVANDVAHTLSVEGKAKAAVEIYDADADQWLATQTPDSKGKFKFALSNLPTMPCSVRVVAGGASVTKPVSKSSACTKGDLPPVCKITYPVADTKIAFMDSIDFVAEAKDPDGTRLHFEWDFGGGASARPTTKNAPNIKFDAQNNTSYSVSFTATDITGRRCTDRLKVTVGTVPQAPAKVTTQTLIKNGLSIPDNEHVVLPFTPYSMEFHDLSYKGMPQMYPINWLHGVVLQKGSVGTDKPVLLDDKDMKLSFSAASNATDPVGADSINSTSQNYPPNATYAEASIKKSDFYEPCEFTGGAKGVGGELTVRGQQVGTVQQTGHPITSASCSFGDFSIFDANAVGLTYGGIEVLPDEGVRFFDPAPWSIWDEVNEVTIYQGYSEPTGVAMPGILQPYQKNDPQAFNVFDPTRKVFEADGIALFPTDDKGRHNPYPVMRVQAEKQGQVVASTDAVVGVSTEFNCAECHSYFGNDKPQRIGADQVFYDKLKADVEASLDGSELAKYKPFVMHIPKFVKPEDLDSARKNDRDIIEQAAMRNIAALHQFTYSFARGLSATPSWMSETEWPGWTIMGRPAKNGTQDACGAFCHRSDPKVNETWAPMEADWVSGGGGACPEYSNSMHNTHGRMQGKLNADFTGTLERDPINAGFLMADLSKPSNPAHPLLLQAKDAGTPESSCLFCHQGKQDKYQRDVMTAAGVNCIDCHGDMAVLAGGSAMAARAPGDNPPDNNLPIKFTEFDRHPYRDGLPSCASCHTGNGDEAVNRRSYDMTTGQFRALPVKDERFAENLTPKIGSIGGYQPLTVTEGGESCPTGTFSSELKPGNNICERGLFKNSLDQHGNMPCASCHGATHATWPNPDPYANDNVTAMQLQGHTGTILECEACHSKDSFKTEDSIGSTLNYPEGILAGPHNMHPVNDPYWYFNDRTGSNPKKNDVDGSLKGGWHNVWAAKPGVNGEDQCASCHGKDHKGTRLSKTPVDRVLKTGKEKKYKDVTVKAGTQIGCDLCHSLEQSFPNK